MISNTIEFDAVNVYGLVTSLALNLTLAISVSTYLPATGTNGGSILISGYLNGVATSYYYNYLGGAMTYDIDKKLPITFTWDPAVASVKFNARLVTSPYTFTASNSMVLEIILR